MASSYRGQYRLGPKDLPTDIQVIDSGGNSLPLRLEVYIARNFKPDWRTLPTEKQYQVLLNVSRLQKLGAAFVNLGDAEECVKEGWLDVLAPNRWALTDAGKKIL